MIAIQDYPVIPVATSVDITYTPREDDGYCDVLIQYYDNNAVQISHANTTLTGSQLQAVLDEDYAAADAFILQRFGIEKL